jgi:DNA-binding NtrC family response regulator/ligand-binding sensor domain-containing protein
MSQAIPVTQARLAFWVHPEHADEFNAHITYALVPILKRIGITRIAPNPRREIEGVCSRLLELKNPDEIDLVQRQLAADSDWITQTQNLAARYAPEPERDFFYRITPYSVTAPSPQNRRTGAGYHEGNWHSFGVRDGMPSSLIKLVLQDRAGNLWLSTYENGICLFDGRCFSSFTQQTGLPSNFVTSILIDSAGQLWCATDKGVCRYDGLKLESFTSEDGLAEDKILSILEDRQNRIWFLSASGHLTIYCDDQFAEFAIDATISDIDEDREGRIWCISQEGGLYRCDGNTSVLIGPDHGLPNERVWSVRIDQTGSIWCATSTAIFRCDDTQFVLVATLDQQAHQETALLFSSSDGALWFAAHNTFGRCKGNRIQTYDIATYRGITCVAEDRSGELWFGSYNDGVYQFDGERFTRYTTREGLGHNYVPHIFSDREGNLWLGTWGGGLCRYDGWRYSNYTRDDGLAHDEVEAICQSRSGDIWFATRGGGASRYDGRTFTNYDTSDGLPNNSLWSIYEDGKANLLFGGNGTQLTRFDGERFVAEIDFDLHVPNTMIWSFSEDSSGRLWLATNGGGIVCYDGEKIVAHFTSANGLPHDVVWKVHVDRNDHLWLATRQGICHYDGKHFTTLTRADGLVHDDVWSLCEDHNGDMWFGTWGGGVCRYDGRSFTSYTRSDGLADNNVRTIYQDEHGVMWFGTYGGGLCRYDGQVFSNLSHKDGLAHDAIQHIVQEDADTYWIATEGGLTRYKPPRTVPSIYLESIVADRRYDIGEEIVISTSQRLLAFEFQGASFTTSPEQFAYVYRLLGRDDTWQTSYQPRVEYHDLPSGQYVFEVRAVDCDLNYSPVSSAALSIVANVQLDRINALQAELSQTHDLDQFIGQSDSLLQALDQIHTVANTDVTALILGETGTGKGLAARAIHGLSARRDCPFIQVNCGAIPEGLIESELFGHEKGAFTGAVQRKIGRFELANGGTIFLDEIGDLPLESQQVLLHVLQYGTLERVGGQRQIQIDVRVVAATNRNLREAMLTKNFREDLYFRLSAFTVHLPPLRRRREDIPLLIHHFVEKFARHLHRPIPHIDAAVLDYLQQYTWPGNVRELEHIAQRAILVCRNDRIQQGDIPMLDADHFAASTKPEPLPPTLVPLDEAEIQLINNALQYCNGIVYGERGAARLLGIHPEKLRAKMRKHGLKK